MHRNDPFQTEHLLKSPLQRDRTPGDPNQLETNRNEPNKLKHGPKLTKSTLNKKQKRTDSPTDKAKTNRNTTKQGLKQIQASPNGLDHCLWLVYFRFVSDPFVT